MRSTRFAILAFALLLGACESLTGVKPAAKCRERSYDVHISISLDTMARLDSIPIHFGGCP